MLIFLYNFMYSLCTHKKVYIKTPQKLTNMLNITIIFDHRRTASKTKNGSVELLISNNGKQKIISTGVRVKKHEWKNGMVVGRFDAPLLNAEIQKKYHELPGDLSGIVYIPADINAAWQTTIAKEMKAVGLNVDMNKLIK